MRKSRLIPMPVAVILATFGMLLLPSISQAQPQAETARQSKAVGTLIQLSGRSGCVSDRSVRKNTCAKARGLLEPGPFMGSRAIALSPNGSQVYVASSKSDAIAIFVRNKNTGTLRQLKGAKGCIAAKSAAGCARAIGLDGPNSIAVSPDGLNVYATSRDASSITTFKRNKKSGALTQLPAGPGCTAGVPVPSCDTGRALEGADVVTISPDGKNVYVGAFLGNAVATFNRDTTTGVLTQPADATGCLTAVATVNCTTGLALLSPEGMAVSKDGANVYVATALSNGVLTLDRDPGTGALTQAVDGSGCIVNGGATSCQTGVEIEGANALEVGPKGTVYATSLMSSSVTAFQQTSDTSGLTQFAGNNGCVEWLGAATCTPGRGLRSPEGIAISPDGLNVYAAAYSSGAIAVLDRKPSNGAIVQKSGNGGCLTTATITNCRRGRALRGLSSIAVSPDGKYVYATAAKSNAVAVFLRTTKRR